jgi:hypothetical protein
LFLSSLLTTRRVLNSCLLGLLLSTISSAADTPLDQQRTEANTTFHAALNKLAQRCDELKLPQQAEQTRRLQIRRRSDQQVIFLPTQQDPLQPAANASQTIRYWHQEVTKHRQAHAQRLFALINPLLASDRPVEAYQLLFEILDHDPTHLQASKIVALPKVPARKPRATLARKRQAQLGWPARSYWTVRSAHYEVLTNRSAKAGIELAEELEQLYQVWHQVFFRYWGNVAVLKARCAGDLQPWPTAPTHRAVLFSNRQEYVTFFSRSQPQIGITTGYYDKRGKTSYFYSSEPSATATWYHEATHQLFQERGQSIDDPGKQQNFWAVEGVALYMESLHFQESYCTLGGFESSRLQYARYDKYINQSYLPLERLLRLGQSDLQGHAEIRALYRQSAGLAHFLMTGTGGDHRRAFIDYLRKIYRGSDQQGTLAAETRKTLPQLDQQYHDFLMVRDQDLGALNKNKPLRQLVLAHTQVTNEGFLQLGAQPEVVWLDLTATRIDEQGMVRLNQWVSLERISLEGTRITDLLVSRLARLPNLLELDLSGTPITDRSLKELGQLTKLRELWLTGTRISDAGLLHLEPLKQLELLNLDQTKVSAAARQRLQEKLPKLKPTP